MSDTNGAPAPAPETVEEKKPLTEEEEKIAWEHRRIARLTADKRILEDRLAEMARAQTVTVPAGEVDVEAIRREERDRISKEAKVAEFNAECNKIAVEGAETYKDWDQSLKRIAETVGPLKELEDKYGFLTNLVAVQKNKSDAKKALHDLSTQPARLESILQLDEKLMVLELDKIARAKPKREISEVGEPPSHIDGGTTGVRNPLHDAKAPMNDYARARNAELAARAAKGDHKARRLMGYAP